MKRNLLPIGNIRKYLSIGGFVIAAAMMQSCNESGDQGGSFADEETIVESTKGVITELEEVGKDEFKIIDEQIIDDKSKSQAIVHNLDGSIDSIPMENISKDSVSTPRRSALNSILMYGLAASFLRRNLGGTNPNAAAYKNQSAYNKSTGLKNDLTRTATSRRVPSPAGGSKGYGGGKSFRSYGG